MPCVWVAFPCGARLLVSALDFATDLKWPRDSVKALHVLSESYLQAVFRAADAVRRHSGRRCLEAKDLQLARRLRRERD